MTDTTVLIHHQVWVREGEGFARALCDGGTDTARDVIEVNGADCPDCLSILKLLRRAVDPGATRH